MRPNLSYGTTISYLPAADKSNQWRIIGTTGSIIKLFSGTGQFQLLSFAELGQFGREGRLTINGKLYTGTP